MNDLQVLRLDILGRGASHLALTLLLLLLLRRVLVLVDGLCAHEEEGEGCVRLTALRRDTRQIPPSVLLRLDPRPHFRPRASKKAPVQMCGEVR